jgi:hypothetical protein
MIHHGAVGRSAGWDGFLSESASARAAGAVGPSECDLEESTAPVEREASNRSDVLLLMTHRSVGPLTALAHVLMSAGKKVCVGE